MNQFKETDFKGNPYVYKVDWCRLTLTASFRIKLYRIWKEKGATAVLTEMKAAKLGPEKVGTDYIESLINSFKNSGFPFCRQQEIELEGIEENPLVKSGKFCLADKGNGLKLTAQFEEELFAQYPEVSVEEGLQNAGLDLLDVGISRINRIRKEFEVRAKELYVQAGEKGDTNFEKEGENSFCTDENADSVRNPYVLDARGRKLNLTECFYNEAKPFIDLGLNSILEIFEIDGGWLNNESKIEIGAKLRRWERTDKKLEPKEGQALDIFWNQEKAMSRLVAEGFARIGQQLPEFSPQQKRSLCRWIQDLPRDPWGFYTTRNILNIIGMSKSTYYEFLTNENYGRSAERKARKDAEDILLVRQVAAYKGYQKGYRQVYMMMESVTGQRMSIHRVLNLMRMDGIRTTIRRPSKNRKAMKELIQRNGQPNLLDRRFRQHRPNQVRLTDVTYMDYGDEQRAYGSASIDPVTGRLICFVVSESNHTLTVC